MFVCKSNTCNSKELICKQHNSTNHSLDVKHDADVQLSSLQSRCDHVSTSSFLTRKTKEDI